MSNHAAPTNQFEPPTTSRHKLGLHLAALPLSLLQDEANLAENFAILTVYVRSQQKQISQEWVW